MALSQAAACQERRKGAAAKLGWLLEAFGSDGRGRGCLKTASQILYFIFGIYDAYIEPLKPPQIQLNML